MIPILRLVFSVLCLPCILCTFSLNDNVIINNKASDESEYLTTEKQELRSTPLHYPILNNNTSATSRKLIPNLIKNQKKPVRSIEATSETSKHQKDVLNIVGSGSNHGTRKKREKCKRKGKGEKSLMEKMLPMMATPFLISSSMVPMMLVSLFFAMIKSAFIGKIGIILMLINMFTNRRNSGGATTHTLNMENPGNRIAMDHYGWHGDEEYGAYVNKRRRKRS
ncbi:uncharacterized protein LOC130447561 [Diorhabda sublineata]|uniref:uncharacterized protein LOC130447561 n=1 Tax=Diorhabda sublineata TaxID=1163346 RepID=UPI0024E18443|nr:uncharacterized protein LOC130447561 [Diorhabda sublineata]